MKLWESQTDANTKMVEDFTIANDRELDLVLARFDVESSLAHIQMLRSIGLLTDAEHVLIQDGLKEILQDIEAGTFKIMEGVEDIHSQIESVLTQRLGATGKKVHSGRSRNDQVLTDIKLYLRYELREITKEIEDLFNLLIELSEEHKEKLLPGYTHFQLAMPSSFGLWFGSYAESLVDDMELIVAAYNVANKNPLGSGAGYGSSFPLDRQMTTALMEFKSMNFNVVYAQMTRGKVEKVVSMAMASVAATLSKLAYDVCLYMNQNFGFLTFSDHLTTGSSIMPHKKNPDVFELIRAKCNKIQALPNELTMLTNNLPSGYHRDMQLTKESLFPAIKELKSCLGMTVFMLRQVHVKDGILEDKKYVHLFSVEEVNKRVLEGIPFREAYKMVKENIKNGELFLPEKLRHTHIGSIGNPGNEKIVEQMNLMLEKIRK